MNRTSKNKNRWWIRIALLGCWFFLVMYPVPWLLPVSLYRLYRPPLESLQVADMAESLQGSSPEEVEEFVYQTLPYRFDWEAHGMPWYFPTLDEALVKGYGDCKSRYLLFASLLENLGIPYEKHISPTHIWVSYEGKIDTTIENHQVSFYVTDETGAMEFQWPQIDAGRSWGSFVEGFWDVMPLSRKILLFSGFLVIMFATSMPSPTTHHYHYPPKGGRKLRQGELCPSPVKIMERADADA